MGGGERREWTELIDWYTVGGLLYSSVGRLDSMESGEEVTDSSCLEYG